ESDLLSMPENVRRGIQNAGPRGAGSVLQQHVADMQRQMEQVKALRANPAADIGQRQGQAEKLIDARKRVLEQMPAELERFMSRNSPLYVSDAERNAARTKFNEDYRQKIYDETPAGVRKLFPGATPEQVERSLNSSVPRRFARIGKPSTDDDVR